MQNEYKRWLFRLCLIAALSGILLFGISEFSDLRRRLPFLTGTPNRILKPGEAPNAGNFAPEQVVSRMPPITDIRHLDATDIDNEVLPNELVIGVVIDGSARAYPVNVMTGPSREVLNDELGGQVIAATW